MPISNLSVSVSEALKQLKSEDIDALFDAIDQASRGSGIPAVMSAGMVINPKTVGKFKKLLQLKLLDKMIGNKIPDSIDIAQAFFETKYPKLASLGEIKRSNRRKGSTRAEAFLGSDLIRLYNKSLEYSDIKNIIETIGHEYTHLYRNKRNPANFKNYVSPLTGYYDYFYQPEEIFARRGGLTAQKSYRNFLKLLLENKETPLNTPEALDPNILALKLIFK